jgi:hypothetical protein
LAASIVIDPNSVNLHIAAAGLTGDYNGDGKVDAADYIVWRRDPTNPTYGGNPGGYTNWRANFGKPPGSGSGSLLGAAVPEPSSVALVGLLALLVSVRRRRGANLVFVQKVATHPAL